MGSSSTTVVFVVLTTIILFVGYVKIKSRWDLSAIGIVGKTHLNF